MTAGVGVAASRVRARDALLLDAAVTGANGIVYLAAAAPLEDLLGLDAALLRGVGVSLVAFAAMLYATARRRTIPGAAMTSIAGCNAAWAAVSLVAAAAQWGGPTTAGTVWIVLQALTVAGFASLQLASRRR